MVRKEIDFENWLMEYHCEQNPELLDDMLPDCFADWVTELDADTWMELGNKYAQAIHTRFQEEIDDLRTKYLQRENAIELGENNA